MAEKMWLVAFVLGLIPLSLGQVAEGTPCYNPSDEYGICISIRKCAPLIELLRSHSNNPAVRSFLRSSKCGSDGSTPLVCCPQTLRINMQFEEARNTDSDGSSSEEKVVDLLSPPDCGFSNMSNTRVVGGVPAALGEFPWIVALGYKNPANVNLPKWLCGGTMITERHVLTAGHCVYNRNDLYLARVGEHDIFDDNDGATAEDIPLLKAKIHEDYSSSLYTNDIAILTLSKKPTTGTVWPICLPHAEPYRSNTFLNYRPIIAGWGAVYFNGPSSSILRVASVPVVKNDKCKKVFENSSTIDDRILCAGWAIGGKDACQGDSGGPLMYGVSEGQNLRYYQIGLVSYGYRCAEAGYPGVYTRITNFIEWIRRNLN